MTNDEIRMTKEARMTNEEDTRPDPLSNFQRNDEREATLRAGERQLHKLAAERGFDWGKMDDEQRLAFVDDLLHEDRKSPIADGFHG